MQHRLDIDGMRAVAVLSVLFYHLFPGLIPFGYLGVDVFFVISGFVITRIIVKQSETASGFSLADFYIRRTRRIIPALLLVLAFCCVISSLLLLPIDLVGFGKSTLATQFFIANIFFWRDADYFSRLAEEKPLLHMWSLGIEEQFYILLPLILMVTLRRSRKLAFSLIAAGIAVSLIINISALLFSKALPAFYLLPARAWELGAGALMALAPHRSLGNRAAGPLALAGLTLIVLGLFAGSGDIPALPPALPVVSGTVLFILAGTQSGGAETPTARLLAWKPIVGIGLVSYSLYLWHWPLIVFAKYYLVRELHLFEQVSIGLLAMALACLSWKFVEQPFRGARMSVRTMLTALSIGSVAVAAIACTLILQNGFPQRLNPTADAVNKAVGTHYRCPLNDYVLFANYYGCRIGQPDGMAEAVLLGNSHAQMYAPSFDRALGAVNLTGMLVPMNSCKPLLDVNINLPCQRLFAETLANVLREPSVRLVILAFDWDANIDAQGVDEAGSPTLLTTGVVEAGLDRTIHAIQAAGKRVVLIGPIAVPGFDIASVVGRKLAFGHPITEPMSTDKAAFLLRWQGVLDHYRSFPDLILAEPHTIQCTGLACEFFLDGRSLFADSSHIAQAETTRFDALFAQAVARASQK